MKPRILVIYYTQTGQLRQILESITSGISDKADIQFAAIEPEKPFPFPWTATTFFDAMPETVEHLPAPVKPLSKQVYEGNYDLIIFGYQPWFLNPSQPVTAFLQGQFAGIMKDKPVITVVGSRNMWLHAQEKVKAYLTDANAHLVGNIVLTDSNPNLVSLITVIRWTFKGQKTASRLLPAAGVQDDDINDANRFGPIILRHLADNNLIDLHRELLAADAVRLNAGLVLLEQRGIKNFRFWAKFIREKGGPGDPARLKRVLLFKRLLLVGIFILSPVTSIGALVSRIARRNSLMKDVDYFRQLQYEKGRI